MLGLLGCRYGATGGPCLRLCGLSVAEFRAWGILLKLVEDIVNINRSYDII